MKLKVFITIISTALSINLFSQTAESYFSQGRVYELQEKDYDKAKEYYLHALKLQPDYVSCYENLGRIYHKIKKDYYKAIVYYQLYVGYRSDAKAYLNMANCYLSIERPDYNKGIQCCEEAIKLKSDYADAYCLLASIYNKTGNRNKYLEYLKKSRQLENKDEK